MCSLQARFEPDYIIRVYFVLIQRLCIIKVLARVNWSIDSDKICARADVTPEVEQARPLIDRK